MFGDSNIPYFTGVIMSDLNNQNQDTEYEVRSELIEKGKALGLVFPANIKTDKLREMINAKQSENDIKFRGKIRTSQLDPEVQRTHDTALALVRFRIRVLDPTMMQWTGYVVSVGNDNLAPIRRVIPLNTDSPWTAERIIVDALKAKKYPLRTKKRETKWGKDYNLTETSVGQYAPCFHIEELPWFSEEELEALRKRQAQEGTGQMEEGQH